MKTEEELVISIIEKNINGAFVECGIWDAAYPALWILKLQYYGRYNVDIYMYDTFAGMTEPSEFDYTRDDTLLYKMTKEEVYTRWYDFKINDTENTWCYANLDSVKKYLYSFQYPEEKLKFIVGDVRKTLLKEYNIPKNIAILRLDTDWYDSTKIELEKLYNNVVSGGLIIFDDYYHWKGHQKAIDDFLESQQLDKSLIQRINEKTGYIFKT
jgi:hypothetical protein